MKIDARPCNMAPEGNNIFRKCKRGIWNNSDNGVLSHQTCTDSTLGYLYYIQS